MAAVIIFSELELDWNQMLGIMSMVICIYPISYLYLIFIFIVKLFFALLESNVNAWFYIILFQKDTKYNGV